MTDAPDLTTTPTRLEAYLLGRSADERRHRRVVVSLPVRYVISGDEEERRGLLYDMSPGGLSVTTQARPAIGAHAVLYIDELGRVEGDVARHHPFGFAVRLSATHMRRDRLAEQLTWHANRHRLQGSDLRRHERIETDHETVCVLPDGVRAPCRVVDLSLSGAALEIDRKPPVGTAISIGRMHGRVVRHTPRGFAIRFLQVGVNRAALSVKLGWDAWKS